VSAPSYLIKDSGAISSYFITIITTQMLNKTDPKLKSVQNLLALEINNYKHQWHNIITNEVQGVTN